MKEVEKSCLGVIAWTKVCDRRHQRQRQHCTNQYKNIKSPPVYQDDLIIYKCTIRVSIRTKPEVIRRNILSIHRFWCLFLDLYLKEQTKVLASWELMNFQPPQSSQRHSMINGYNWRVTCVTDIAFHNSIVIATECFSTAIDNRSVTSVMTTLHRISMVVCSSLWVLKNCKGLACKKLADGQYTIFYNQLPCKGLALQQLLQHTFLEIT